MDKFNTDPIELYVNFSYNMDNVSPRLVAGMWSTDYELLAVRGGVGMFRGRVLG